MLTVFIVMFYLTIVGLFLYYLENIVDVMIFKSGIFNWVCKKCGVIAVRNK